MKSGTHGFSLIELMVTIAILAILVSLAMPSFRQWSVDTRIRTAAESIQNGLRLARNEAVQRASPVRFELDAASSGTNWTVCSVLLSTDTCSSSGAVRIQQFVAAGGAADIVLSSSTQMGDISSAPSSTVFTSAVSGGVPGGVTFDALGRPLGYGSSSMLRVDAYSTLAGTRRMVNVIAAGGMVRMCDPQIQRSVSSQGCV